MKSPSIELLAQAFDQHSVRYTIIGGYALLLSGASNSTQDIDISIAYEEENLVRLASALMSLNPTSRTGQPITVDKFAFSSRFCTFYTDAGIVQVISRPQGFENYEDLESDSKLLRLDNQIVRIASLDALKKMKSETGRIRDLEHLESIARLKTVEQTSD